MMLRRCFERGLVIALPAVALIFLAGCSGANSLPSTVVIELPDGTSVEVDQNTGVASLADSSWDFFQGTSTFRFATITFGPTGNLMSFENSQIAQEVFGSTLIFDGERHPTEQDGIDYAATTFGAETSDATGFAFEGRLSAFLGGIQVAAATAKASGVFDPDDPDLMTGTFDFSSVLTVPIEIPGAEVDQSFEFTATRVP